jgi:hypothetical protein
MVVGDWLQMGAATVALLAMAWGPCALVIAVPYYGLVRVPRWWFTLAGSVAVLWAVLHLWVVAVVWINVVRGVV